MNLIDNNNNNDKNKEELEEINTDIDKNKEFIQEKKIINNNLLYIEKNLNENNVYKIKTIFDFIDFIQNNINKNNYLTTKDIFEILKINNNLLNFNIINDNYLEKDDIYLTTENNYPSLYNKLKLFDICIILPHFKLISNDNFIYSELKIITKSFNWWINIPLSKFNNDIKEKVIKLIN